MKANPATQNKTFAYYSPLSTFTNDWILDSGASAHLCTDASLLEDLHVLKKPITIHTASSGNDLTATKAGTLRFTNSNYNIVTIEDVLIVPGLTSNLISQGLLMEKGLSFFSSGNSTKATNHEGDVIFDTKGQNKLQILKMMKPESAHYSSTNRQVSLNQWHNRFGHSSPTILAAGIKAGAFADLPRTAILNWKVPDCPPCLLGKATRKPMPKGTPNKSTAPLDKIHLDLTGKSKVTSQGNSNYVMFITDDYSKMRFAIFLSRKSGATEKLTHWCRMAERHTNRKVKTIQCDQGSEFTNSILRNWCTTNGIRLQFSNVATPQENGLAEVTNRIIFSQVRAILVHTRLPKYYWTEIVASTVYLRNRTPTQTLNYHTPYEFWFNQKPAVSHLRPIGTSGYVYARNETGKLGARSELLRLVGYDPEINGYRMADLEGIIVSRDVTFTTEASQTLLDFVEIPEPTFIFPPDDAASDATESDLDEQDIDQDPANYQVEFEGPLPPPRLPSIEPDTQLDQSDHESDFPTDPEDSDYLPSDSDYHSLVDDNDNNEHYATLAQDSTPSHSVLIPLSLQEAISSPEESHWSKARELELESLHNHGTFTVEDLPLDRKAIGCKWVFDLKYNKSNCIEKFKARLVAKGYSQVDGVDYFETYAPVAHLLSVRTLVAISALHDSTIYQMDVVTAFLNGNLDERIYMKAIPGIPLPPGKALLLHRSLYGLKQAARQWYIMVSTSLKEFGFIECPGDHCLFRLEDKGGVIFLVLYVDDLLIATRNKPMLKAFEKFICSKYKMKLLGIAEQCLGIRIDRTADGYHLGQERYSSNIIQRFDMAHARPMKTPMDPNFETFTIETDREVSKAPFHYRSAIGSLTYLASSTRPDIATAVNILAQFQEQPAQRHFDAVKNVLRYLLGSKDLGIHYLRKGNSDPEGYCDSNWKSPKSRSGLILRLADGPILWKSSRQDIVAQSSCEAEYVALSPACKAILWTRQIWAFMTDNIQLGATILYGDNQAAIALAKLETAPSRTRHIALRFHLVREHISSGEIDLRYISTDLNLADCLTKPLNGNAIASTNSRMNILPCPKVSDSRGGNEKPENISHRSVSANLSEAIAFPAEASARTISARSISARTISPRSMSGIGPLTIPGNKPTDQARNYEAFHPLMVYHPKPPAPVFLQRFLQEIYPKGLFLPLKRLSMPSEKHYQCLAEKT
jgi:transposase InsO family protein